MSGEETLTTDRSLNSSDTFEYRALSTRAIASTILGVLSLLIFAAGAQSLQAALLISPLPLIGATLGLAALGQMRASPNSYSGAKLAVFGVGFCLLSLLGGLGYAGYVYSTEVPPDHQRITFASLRPDEVDQRAGRTLPEEVADLDGRQVFIKGYMRPDSTHVRSNVKQFLLVRDNNQCCFGDISTVKFYDQIGVHVAEDVRLDKSLRLLRMAGTLHVDERAAAAGEKLVFRLDAKSAQ